MDIKLIKELCEEHNILIKTNEKLGKMIDSEKDNYIEFKAVEGELNLGAIYLSKACMSEVMKKNIARMNEIENALNATDDDSKEKEDVK